MSGASRPEDQLRQFAGNLVTPDIYSPYSTTYSWVANQTAHVGLGLLVASVVLAVFPGVRTWAPHWFLLLFFGPYFLKESVDLVKGLRLDKNILPKIPGELSWDIAADLFFVSAGIAIAISVFGAWPGVAQAWAGVGTAAVFVIGTLVFGRRNVPARRAFDKSGLPFYARLPTYEATFTEEDAKAIGEFLENGTVRHVLVHGEVESGKTTLGAALGSGLGVRRGLVRYLSAAKLGEQLKAATRPSSGLRQPWTLEEARVFVVDDLDPEDDNWTKVLSIEALAKQLEEKRSALVFSAPVDPESVRSKLGIAEAEMHVIDSARLDYQPPGESVLSRMVRGVLARALR